MKTRRIIKYLETTFRIGRQIQLWIIQWKNQPMIGSTINIPQNKIKIPNRDLPPEIR